MVKAGSTRAKDKGRLNKNENLKEEFKQVWNWYYQIIKKVKHECYENFLWGKI